MADTGLPWLEQQLAKYIGLPLLEKQAVETRTKETVQLGLKLIEQVDQLSPEQQKTVISVARPRGLEAISCHWSAAMVVEHLLIVHQGVTGIIQTLAQGESSERVVRIEDVKPTGQRDWESLASEYRQALEQYETVMTPLTARIKSSLLTHPHPWFGPITAKRWHTLSLVHLQAHAEQLKRILHKLK